MWKWKGVTRKKNSKEKGKPDDLEMVTENGIQVQNYIINLWLKIIDSSISVWELMRKIIFFIREKINRCRFQERFFFFISSILISCLSRMCPISFCKSYSKLSQCLWTIEIRILFSIFKFQKWKKWTYNIDTTKRKIK